MVQASGRLSLGVVSVLAFASGTAVADVRALHRPAPVIIPSAELPAAGAPTRVLWLDRCVTGCTVVTGSNDAANNSSNIPMGAGEHTVTPFGFGDTEWNQIVKCVKDVYSPYQITITETAPSDGFNRIIVAGTPGNVGLGNMILGIAPLAQDCRALTNTIAFAFANQHPPNARVENICWTVAQESAHIYGLDHEFQFVDGASACSDPMTYRTDCGGEKFFRDRDAQCGEDTVRDCTCKGVQNSHQNLLGKFGAGTITSTPPVVSIVVPLTNTVFANGQAVQVRAGAQRGIEKLVLDLNGYPWQTKPGVRFGPTGQGTTTYPFLPPNSVPDGIIDIDIKAYDDLGVVTTSDTVRVTKGVPCADASTCLTGQKCEAGKCFWDPPTGQIGDACPYPQFCESGVCPAGTCEQPCDPTSSRMTCPDGFTCGGDRACIAVAGGGCCSVSSPGAGWIHGGLGAITLGVVFRRRQRRNARSSRD